MRRSYWGARTFKRWPRKRGGGRKKTRKRRDPDDAVGVLVMRDRESRTLPGALDAVDAQMIDGTVGHRLGREAVLCTDGAPVHGRYARERGVVHEPVNLVHGVRVRRPAFNVQKRQRLSQPMERLGRALPRPRHPLPQSLIGWHRMLDALRRESAANANRPAAARYVMLRLRSSAHRALPKPKPKPKPAAGMVKMMAGA